jgi:hypothetical protein
MVTQMRKQKEMSSVVASVAEARGMITPSSRAEVNKPLQRRRDKLASYGAGFGLAGGLSGMNLGFGNSGSVMGTATNIYSPQLSTDFLELPQNLVEMRAYYRFFYNNDPYVGQAIDLHTELPLSKIRLALPKGKDPKKNREVLTFFESMVNRIDLLNVLLDATREYYVIGEAFLFAEDTTIEDVPDYITKERVNIIDADTGETSTQLRSRENAEELERQYKQAQYKGWDRVILLPPDQVRIESFQYSNRVRVELEPDDKIKRLVQKALMGDEQAKQSLEDVPAEIIEYIENNENLPLSTDPYEGSFVYHLARKKPPGQDHGVSILQRCLRTLVHRDKLRQTQASIASRAMTPKRLIWAEDASEADVEDLRVQVDMALLDPDYSIITNFQVNWEEISARDRLLDLNSENDMTDRQLFAGLGVTESMLTGEGAYTGERVNIEVINTRYMLYRENIQHYVEEYLFKPIAEKKGFYEYDEFGNKVLLYPTLSFTRLALRDNRDTFDAMFNLYQKGSLSVGYILELFNLDPQAVEERLRQDLMTVNDAMFNEIIRSAYSEIGRALPERSDVIESVIKYLKLTYVEPPKDGDRFG